MGIKANLLLSVVILTGCTDEEKINELIEILDTEMIFVKGGQFMMGDAGNEFIDANGNKFFDYWSGRKDNKHVHSVKLSDFWMGKYEITYEKYEVFLANTKRKPNYLEKYKRTENLPVAADWYDGQLFCEWMATVSGKKYALPTEAQWEYAARNRGANIAYATNTGTFIKGENMEDHDPYVMPVGTYPPNPLGIYDLSSNSSEWVADWYAKNYYEKSPVQDPQGPKTGTEKVRRGGSISHSPEYSHVYGRVPMDIDWVKNNPLREGVHLIGPHISFRCAINTQ